MPKPKDATRNERQRRRQEKLDKYAQYLGYDTWRKFETDVANGKINIVIV